MNLRQQEAKAKREADSFNSNYSTGTTVRYWTGLKRGPGKESKTRSSASVVSCQAVVWVEGESSCICLSHIEVIQSSSQHEYKHTLSEESNYSPSQDFYSPSSYESYNSSQSDYTHDSSSDSSSSFSDFGGGDFGGSGSSSEW